MPPRTITQDTIEEAEAELVRRGIEALGRIKQTFDNWMEVARALNVGRREAMTEAHTDNTDDRGYRKAFSRWLQAHPPFDDKQMLPQATRSWLLRCYDHEAEIVAWRANKPLELVRYHYPETVFKRWAQVNRPELLTPKQQGKADPAVDQTGGRPNGDRKRQGQSAAIDEAVDRLARVADNLHDLGVGTQLTLDLSTPDLVAESARMVIDIYGAAYGNEMVLAFAAELQRLIETTALTPAHGDAVEAAWEAEAFAARQAAAPEPELPIEPATSPAADPAAILYFKATDGVVTVFRSSQTREYRSAHFVRYDGQASPAPAPAWGFSAKPAPADGTATSAKCVPAVAISKPEYEALQTIKNRRTRAHAPTHSWVANADLDAAPAATAQPPAADAPALDWRRDARLDVDLGASHYRVTFSPTAAPEVQVLSDGSPAGYLRRNSRRWRAVVEAAINAGDR